ncbi:hypothetical protein KSP40_PGU012674 [Platanthera guangdongensis]|uniref:Uncharacterized protein n=1 Tax=Platanthera guangdongensis TaxID=2320717 RepID=A0ABR2N2Z3_9ASPA
MEETYKTLLELHDTQMREKGEDKLTPEEAYTTVLRHHSGYIPGMGPGPKPLERKHTNVQKLREEIRAEFDVEMNIRIKGLEVEVTTCIQEIESKTLALQKQREPKDQADH